MTSKDVMKNLKDKGFKVTKARQDLIELLLASAQPLTVPEISHKLESEPNKTTIYREITFLKELGIIKEIDFGENKKRYESDLKDHHHHLICLNCQKIEDFELEKDLKIEEKKIKEKNNFKVMSHSLEFFGLCRRCA